MLVDYQNSTKVSVSKKQTKQTRRTDRIVDAESILRVARWDWVWGKWVQR